jgi:hypothetical protein
MRRTGRHLEGFLAVAQLDLVARVSVEEVDSGTAVDRVAVVPVRPVDQVVTAAAEELVLIGCYLILYRVVAALAPDRVVSRPAFQASSLAREVVAPAPQH